MDNGYRGEVGVLVVNIERPISLNMKTHVIEKGTCITQGVIAPVVTAHFVEVNELLAIEGIVGGFGSGRNKVRQNLNFIKKRHCFQCPDLL